jgi:hypothetical protein
MLSLMGLLLIIAIILMITKNKCVAVCYGFCLLIPFIVLTIVGAVVIGANYGLPILLENQCSDSASYFSEADQAYTDANDILCSSLCPCDASATLFSDVSYAD